MFSTPHPHAVESPIYTLSVFTREDVSSAVEAFSVEALPPPGESPSIERRYTNIEDWLVWGEERYSLLLSRASETASLPGWDNEPRMRPCECKWEWRRGKLCLMCDNTRFRACDPGDERAIDPYALGVTQIKGGFHAKSAGDESAAQKLAASIARLSSLIASLERTRMQREDVEAAPDRAMQQLIQLVGDTLDRAPRQYRKIMLAVHHLRAERPKVAARLPERRSIIELSPLISGKVEPCRA